MMKSLQPSELDLICSLLNDRRNKLESIDVMENLAEIMKIDRLINKLRSE